MKFVIVIFVFALALLSLSNNVRGQTNEASGDKRKEVEKTVLAYLEASAKKDRRAIKKLVSRTPPFYHQYQRDKFSAETTKDSKINLDPKKMESPSSTPLDNAWYELVLEGFALPVKGIQSVWIKGNYARARVIADGRYSGLTSDALLTKHGGAWKIFMILSLSESEQFPL
jgi:hypothetical protein